MGLTYQIIHMSWQINIQKLPSLQVVVFKTCYKGASIHLKLPNIVSILGWDEGYMLKYSPKGIPEGKVWGNSQWQRDIFDRISWVESSYGQYIISLNNYKLFMYRCWEKLILSIAHPEREILHHILSTDYISHYIFPPVNTGHQYTRKYTWLRGQYWKS